VTRWRHRATAAKVPPLAEVHLQLDMGHEMTDYSLAELRAAWEAYSETIMADWHGGSGTRPWGWWRFEAEEEPPDAEATRLAQLGVLTDAERRVLPDAVRGKLP
jgi:hypothetical protein